jgi:hypothetical protein
LESRFFIPQVTGTLDSVEGIDAASKVAGVEEVKLFKKPGEGVIAPPDDTFDYVGYVTTTGSDYKEAMGRMMEALGAVKIKVRQADGTIVEQGGEAGHWPVDPNALINAPAPAKDGLKTTLKKLVEALKNLPSSFKNFVVGGSLRSMAEEGMAIVTSIYGIKNFGLAIGVASMATELGFRIVGMLYAAKLAAKYVKRFDAKRIYIITTTVQALLYLSLVGVGVLAGPASPFFLGYYFFVQVMRGIIYGAARGMAENQIMPRLVGQDAKKLETAGFIFMLSTEATALIMAFILSPLIRSAFGANVLIGVAAAIMLTSVGFFKKIKFSDEASPAPAAAEAQAKTEEKPAQDDKVDSLPVREYIPYVASSFLHFSLYTFLAGIFASYTFRNEFMSDRSVGAYDGGSLVISLIAAIPGLLASIGAAKAALNGGGSAQKKDLMDRLSLKGWYGAAVASAAAFMILGALGLSIPALVAASALGALVTVNRTKWMASYYERLKPEHHGKLSARLNSIGVAAALVPFLAISLGKIAGIALAPVIMGIVAVLTVALGVSWLLTRQPEAKK